MNVPFKLPLSIVTLVTLIQSNVIESAAQSLFTDNFDTDTSSAWAIHEGSGNGTADFTAQFGFDYGTFRYVANGVTNAIPPAPNGGATTRGLKLTVNNNDDVAATAAVSLFPRNATFSNSYALRVDMWLNYNGPAFGGPAGSTEHATFGLNHAGDKVVWHNASFPGDGVWFAVAGEAGAGTTPLSDYNAFVGDGATAAVRLQGTDGGFLDRDGDGTLEFEVNPSQGPNFPLKWLFPAPQFETGGAPGKRWVQVEVRQRTGAAGNTITWLLDGYVIAEHNQGDSFGQRSGKIMIGYLDAFTSIANPREENFVLFDNLRVVNLESEPALPVISIAAADPTASEAGTDTGAITISRTGPTTGPLTVQLRLGGTAANGADFAMVTNSITLPAGASSAELVIRPINDSIGEADETVSVILVGAPSLYDVRDSVAATVTIADDGDVPTATLSVIKPVAYELNPRNAGQVRLNLSTPNASATPVNLLIGGTASNGVDYVAITNVVTVPAGATNALIHIAARDNNAIDADRTVAIALAARSGYVLGTVTNATVTIRNDDLAPGNLLFSETFDTDNTASWTVNQGPSDGVTEFFFDYSTAGIPPAPRSSGGSTRGLKLQANVTSAVFGGLSVSPTGKEFTGDYRLRFDMWLNYNGPLPAGGNGSTQVTGAGVGTAGATPQWAGGTQDSVWFGTTGEGGSSVDYRAYSSAAAAGYVETNGVFAAGATAGVRNNTHAYYAQFGAEPAPEAQLAMFPSQTGVTSTGAAGFQWRDVVITKKGSEISWTMDGLLIATVNAGNVKLGGGNILFNHFDINATASTDPNAASLLFGLIDNVQVETLASSGQAPRITAIRLVGGNVEIEFSGGTGATYKLQSSASITGFADEPAATIIAGNGGSFRATAPIRDGMRFFRITR